ncbi:MAG: hypothetical protein CL421_00015 [Acidimicrobiaceae bacterium]|nr:hypothetical protein [Acidimicrobiaceae bacterium]
MGSDGDEEKITFSVPPLQEDRLWRHPAEVGQLKRINRSMKRFRSFGKVAICVGFILLWGSEILSFLS